MLKNVWFFFSNWNLISDKPVVSLFLLDFHCGFFFIYRIPKIIRINPSLILASHLNANLISSNGYKNSVMINHQNQKISQVPFKIRFHFYIHKLYQIPGFNFCIIEALQ